MEAQLQTIARHFLFEVNYAYPNRLGISIPEYFLVDMVSFANLDKFLEAPNVKVKAAKVMCCYRSGSRKMGSSDRNNRSCCR